MWILIVYIFVNYADVRKAPVTTGQYVWHKKNYGIWWYDEIMHHSYFFLRFWKRSSLQFVYTQLTFFVLWFSDKVKKPVTTGQCLNLQTT